jgi:hypothetical protein
MVAVFGGTTARAMVPALFVLQRYPPRVPIRGMRRLRGRLGAGPSDLDGLVMME